MRNAAGLNVAIVAELGVTKMCMTPEQRRQSSANCRMWLIRNYMHDLAEHFAGDEGRFSRMVVDQGKSLQTAHPHGWTQHIVNCTTDEAVEFYRDELIAIYQRLVAWKLLAEVPEVLTAIDAGSVS